MSDKDTSDTNQTKYYIRINDGSKPKGVVQLFRDLSFQGSNQFACNKCGALVTVSEKKAKKLRKMRKPNILCKTCKRVRKARHRR